MPTLPDTTTPAARDGEALPNFLHTSYTKDLAPRPRTSTPDAWIAPLLLLLLFAAGLINTFYFKEARRVLLSVFKRDGLRKLGDEDSIIIRRTQVLLLLLSFTILPVFLYQLAGYMKLTAAFSGFIPLYLQLLLIVTGMVGLKLFSIQALGYLFNRREESAVYINGIMVINGITGLLLIPVSLGILLAPGAMATGFVITGSVITVLLYLHSLVTGLKAGIRGRISTFHLILYLCTLEILPVFVFVKAVKVLAERIV